MKKLFGKILVGAVGCVMALGINAFADNTISDIKIEPNVETLTVTITGNIKGDDASPESTILVAPEGVSLLTDVTDENIKYIDQETAQSGKFEYTFKLKEAGKYNVWFGGTAVANPTQDVINLTAASDAFKLVGTVKVEYEYEKDIAKSYGDVVAVANPITATDADGKKTYGEAINGTVSAADKQFTVEVPAGTYDVVVGKPGYLYKTVADVEVAGDMALQDVVELIAGDVFGDGDGFVNITDLSDIITKINLASGQEGFEAKYDVNDDGFINISDITIVITNIGK